MRSAALPAIALAALFGLSACGVIEDARTIARDLGKDDRGGDDISSNAPLTLPPDAGLRPPATPSQTGSETGNRARVILRVPQDSGSAPGTTPRRPGERSDSEGDVLRRAGMRSDTSGVVRRTVDIEAERRGTGERSFTDRVLKFDPNAKAPESKEDGEARRVASDVPVIKRKGEF
jgi:hypothetical protein